MINGEKLKVFCSMFLALAITPYAQAYIDPGTGGYLISSLWAWIVGVVAVMFAGVTHFFKYRLRAGWNEFPAKKKLLVVIVPLVLISGASAFFIYGNSEYEVPDYDPDFVNVMVNEDGASEGYTLVKGKLIDMDGAVVHEWPYWYLGVIDDNGDFYAQREYESLEWGRYSWNGSVIWEKEMPIHHEILLTPQDTVIVLTKETHEYNERKVEFDVIVEFDKDGNFIGKWSTWDNLEKIHQHHADLELDKAPSITVKDNAWKNTSIWGGNYDYYHMNAVSLIPNNSMEGLHAAFKPGNYLISFRHGSMVFIVDKDSGDIVWKAIYDQVEDNLEGPHAPQMLGNGNILIYDNGRYREWTRLVTIDTITLDVLWEYKDDEFFSYSQGFLQILPNNNILITESEEGHVFEIDSNENIVWEWWNPKMITDIGEKTYGKREDIYRAIRYDKSFIDGLLE